MTRRQPWWGRAWTRAVEETAYDARTLTRARTLLRTGAVSDLRVAAGSFAAVVEPVGEGRRLLVGGTVPVLDLPGHAAFLEVCTPSRLAALEVGDLPHDLVEDAEEAGVELLAAGGELGTTCTCTSWVDPCPHALAVLLRVGVAAEDDPFVLLRLRGITRAQLGSAPSSPGPDSDVEVALEAALRAARELADLLVPGPDADPGA